MDPKNRPSQLGADAAPRRGRAARRARRHGGAEDGPSPPRRGFGGWIALWGPILATSLFAAVLYHNVISIYAKRKFGGDISGLLCIGDYKWPERILPAATWIHRHTPGYDGQFHYLIAQDLLATSDVVRYVDNPAYRYQRILYPALAAMAAHGDLPSLPAAMFWVNLLAVAATTGLLALMLRRRARSPWLALVYPLFGGLMLATLRDLTEPTALFFLVLSLHCYLEARVLPAAAALAAAILGRETLLAMVPVLALDALVRRRDRRAALLLCGAVVPFALWAVYLHSQFGAWGLAVGERVFATPGVAVWAYARDLFAETLRAAPRLPERWLLVSTALEADRTYFVLLALALAASLGVGLRTLRRGPSGITVGLIGFTVMPLLMSDLVWRGEVWSFGRVQVLSQTLLLIHFIERRDLLALVPLGLHAASTAWLLDRLDILKRLVA